MLEVLSIIVVLILGTSSLLTQVQLHLCADSKTDSKPFSAHRPTVNMRYSFFCSLKHFSLIYGVKSSFSVLNTLSFNIMKCTI